MSDRLEKLYKKYILEHSKAPFHEYENREASHIIKAYNPLCGDKFTFYFDIEDGHVTRASFSGYGCSISKASSSILTKKMTGMALEELTKLIENFLNIVSEEHPVSAGELTDDEELLAFSGARDFPERKQCATLGWEAVLPEIRDKE
ncbi:MAG: SUF system NifU family Fe-S cluster assembly protein [Cyclobacteriaceae bacterium]|nr:SUF system NifU family Fe-S cluster assembly protein [Cyclobacteriaceae bacterium]